MQAARLVEDQRGRVPVADERERHVRPANCAVFFFLRTFRSKVQVKQTRKSNDRGCFDPTCACGPAEIWAGPPAPITRLMTKTPFFGTMERASDLLEITHTDVWSDERCGARWISLLSHFHR